MTSKKPEFKKDLDKSFPDVTDNVTDKKILRSTKRLRRRIVIHKIRFTKKA
ncbi:MAG: hypothetical protein JXA66_06590 [Oligoflexia bacterium]|nr:hypothetical protein [Oligoflexia bacterium]